MKEKKEMNKIKEILPGFIVCVIIGLIAQQIAKFFPSIGAALFAIGIGMIAGNTFLNKDIFNVGTKFSESRLLEYSIVLTGLTLQLTYSNRACHLQCNKSNTLKTNPHNIC